MKKHFFVFAALLLLFACTTNKNTVTGESFDVTDYSATLTGYANLPLEFGDAEVGIMYDKVKSFEAAKKVVATGLDGNNKFTVTATGLEPSTTYYFKSYVQNGMAVKYGAVKSFTTQAQSYTAVAGEAVDLGLSVKWRSTNLGATSPSDYGDYFAWGETEPKENYSLSTYKWCNGSYSTFTKYNTESSFGTVDNRTVLEPSDDVASVKLGGKWRMPTNAEWTELMTKCTWTWTTMNGVNGRLVTATNGNSIFLPAAGVRDGTSLYSAGSFGYFWSSSLYTGSPDDAWHLGFGSGDVRRIIFSRYYGRSVRPVSE